VQLSSEKLKKQCGQRQMRLSDVLKQAGVSRTAYYSLVRKDSVLPKSILRIARHLDVNPSALLDNGEAKVRHLRDLQNQAVALAKRYPNCDRDVMFRTLLNLELPPIERLRRALIRARKPAFTSNELAFLKELVRQKVDFMIIGLSAAAFQGAPMVTQAVDLWFRDIEEPGIKKALNKMGGSWLPSLGLNPPMFKGAHIQYFDIVLSVHGIGDYDAEKRNTVDVPLGGFSVKVLRLDRVIASKTFLNREKDRMVLPTLKSAA